jgi:hypothetical protein
VDEAIICPSKENEDLTFNDMVGRNCSHNVLGNNLGVVEIYIVADEPDGHIDAGNGLDYRVVREEV